MKKNFNLVALFLSMSHCFSFSQGTSYSGPYSVSSPIVWNGINNATISMLEIVNPSGHCISLSNCSNITIQNCKLGPSKKEGVNLCNCTNITVINCSMDSIETGVYADGCTGIKVIYNDVKNVQGPMPRGQMVQFNNVSGAGNSISYNVGENTPGQSFPEDEISIFMSNGTATDPIQVIGNWIRGGGPSTSGGGIMTGDNGGSYIVVQDNILVDPGQYGISVSGGNHITVSNNRIYARKQSFCNVGLYAWNQSPTACSAITISNNQINYTKSDGTLNDMWNAGNCGTINGWGTNVYNANLSSLILPTKIIGRVQGTTTGMMATPLTSRETKIYPNPASDHITIETSPNIYNGKVILYNIKGQRLIEQFLEAGNMDLDTHNLPGGAYVVKILSDNQQPEEKKLIIGNR
ncbi:MAG: T9SS type A sorting domain-containing protein [Bacteroidota bacterium]|nr:T9SS type A sorting domain-containing protein [Bacteroidota bacterium]